MIYKIELRYFWHTAKRGDYEQINCGGREQSGTRWTDKVTTITGDTTSRPGLRGMGCRNITKHLQLEDR